MLLPSELAKLQEEYETSDITINQLCIKYNCTHNELVNSHNWSKRNPAHLPTVIDSEDTSQYKLTSEQLITSQINLVLNKLNTLVPKAESIKELKEITTILKAYGDLLQPKEPKSEINVVIQNMLNSSKDDC